MFGTVGATKNRSISFHAVADDSALAMLAPRRECVNRTFEAVKRVPLARHGDLKRLVVVVPANFANAHRISP
jgi:hypothetical protein